MSYDEIEEKKEYCLDKENIKFVVEEALKNFPSLHGTILVAQDNEILYHQSFFYPKAPFLTDQHAQYPIASITKQFTAVALLKALYDKHPMLGIPKTDRHKLGELIE